MGHFSDGHTPFVSREPQKAGVGSRLDLRFRLLHVGDTMVVCDPVGFQSRLESVGFCDVSVKLNEGAFSFRGRKK